MIPAIPAIGGKVIGDAIWHSTRRFFSVIIIGVILVGVPFYVYQMGYKKGYSKAVKDRPTYQAESMNINQYKGYNFMGLRMFGFVFGHLKDVRDETPLAIIEKK